MVQTYRKYYIVVDYQAFYKNENDKKNVEIAKNCRIVLNLCHALTLRFCSIYK